MTSSLSRNERCRSGWWQTPHVIGCGKWCNTLLSRLFLMFFSKWCLGGYIFFFKKMHIYRVCFQENIARTRCWDWIAHSSVFKNLTFLSHPEQKCGQIRRFALLNGRLRSVQTGHVCIFCRVTIVVVWQTVSSGGDVGEPARSFIGRGSEQRQCRFAG